MSNNSTFLTKKGLFIIVLVFVGGYFLYHQYRTSTPEFLAKQQYDQGIQLISESHLEEGFKHLKVASNSDTIHSEPAKQKMIELLTDNQYLEKLPPEQVTSTIKEWLDMNKLPADFIKTVEQLYQHYEKTHAYQAQELAHVMMNLTDSEEVFNQYGQKRYKLLTDLIINQSDDLALTIELAKLDEQINQCKECQILLEEHKAELATTEGARILGQVYAYQNNIEEAYRLLSPYINQHLTKYLEAEKAYNKLLNKIWEKSLQDLDDGYAPQSFYDKYEKASKEEQNQLINEFYQERTKTKEVEQKLIDYRKAAFIAPVALDFGIVLLNRATGFSDTKKREEELKKSENMFLSIKNYAGDTDDYRLYLGQVYFWLGKESAGNELFDSLLKKYDRSHQILYSLSETLRNLGAVTKAKEYIMEAYNKAEEKNYKETYAHQISFLVNDTDEKIS